MYLIFYRYYDYTTKGGGPRATGVSRVHHFQVTSKLPAQKIQLVFSKDKKQLIVDADNVIVQQVLSCAAENAESKITSVNDDTDVFVLILHHHMPNLKNVLILSPIKGR